jgi:hypothetical protein
VSRRESRECLARNREKIADDRARALTRRRLPGVCPQCFTPRNSLETPRQNYRVDASLTTSGILRFNSDASENLRNVAPPSSHLRVASAFAWTSTNCRWTVSHDSSRVHQCVARLGVLSSGDSGSLGFLTEAVVFFTPPSSTALILSA